MPAAVEIDTGDGSGATAAGPSKVPTAPRTPIFDECLFGLHDQMTASDNSEDFTKQQKNDQLPFRFALNVRFVFVSCCL